MTSLFKWKRQMLQLELVKAEYFYAPLSRVSVIRERAKEEASLWPFATEHFLPHNLRPPNRLQSTESYCKATIMDNFTKLQ